MADVRFKDLCFDAHDAPKVAAFWGKLLGQRVVLQDDGDAVLAPPEGGPTERTVWINTVTEPLEVKSRVHLDLRSGTADVAGLLALGATLLRAADTEIGWNVLADPEGLEFCAFGPHPRHPDAPGGPYELVVDSVDPRAQANWWAERTGGVASNSGQPWWWVEGAAGFPLLFWVFNRVPEPKTVKNRLHWDVLMADADVGGLVAAGARLLEVLPGWTVLADPEGNEFCAFPG